jgi:hypothetical protein
MPKFFAYLFPIDSAPVSAQLGTTDPLPANGAWSSVVVPSVNLSNVVGSVFSSHTGQLFIEQSNNKVNWDISTEYDVPANDGKGFAEEVLLDFVRVRYVNGGTQQTTFRLSFSVK